jgi:hypothetical protein
MLAALVLASSASASAAERKPIVAVFGIEDRGAKLDAAVLANLTSYLASRLTASGAFEVIPQDRLRQALVARKKESYRGCYAQSCQIEIGQELAASKALSTQVLAVGSQCLTTASLYDLRRATAGQAATAKGPCGEDGLVAALERVVAELAGHRTPAAVRDAPRPVEPSFSPLTLLGVCPADSWGFGLFYGCGDGRARGAQGSIFSYAASLAGVQGIGVNIVTGVARGGQGILANWAGEITGFQAGVLFSGAGSLHGLQLGLVNYARQARGLQLGLVNVARRLVGLQLGLINIALENKLPFFPIALLGW